MAKRKAAATPAPRKPRLERIDYAAVLKSIRRKKGPDTSADEVWLDHFERCFHIELPPSFREFLRKFGSGALSGWCHFFSAGEEITDVWDLFHWNVVHWQNMVQSVPDKDFEFRTMDLVVFGRTWCGECYGFNRREITQKKPREYAIYSNARHFDGLDKHADSFPQFIRDFCIGPGLIDYCFEGDASTFDWVRNDFTPVR